MKSGPMCSDCLERQIQLDEARARVTELEAGRVAMQGTGAVGIREYGDDHHPDCRCFVCKKNVTHQALVVPAPEATAGGEEARRYRATLERIRDRAYTEACPLSCQQADVGLEIREIARAALSAAPESVPAVRGAEDGVIAAARLWRAALATDGENPLGFVVSEMGVLAALDRLDATRPGQVPQ